MSTQHVRAPASPKRLYIKVSPGGFNNASRNKRELGVVKDLGFETLVVTKGSHHRRTLIDNWPVLELSTRPLGANRTLVHLNRFLSLFMWAAEARRLTPAIVSGHDLLGLLIGWLSTWFVPMARRPLLVYDSHEFTVGLWSGWKRRLVRHVEGFLIRRCAFSIMVNDSIADRVQQIHGLADRPVVVRSTPPLWPVDDQNRAQRRAEFLAGLGMPADTFLLMYHGGVIPNRGIEISIRALAGRDGVALVILGNGAPEYLAQLRQLAGELDVADRVLFHEAVPVGILGEYVGAADVGMVIAPPVSDNHYLMLPNKFFENIQSLTPVIANSYPEIAALVHKYNIGLLVDPEDNTQMGTAIDKLRSDPGLRARFSHNLREAKNDLCWENERGRLAEAYGRLIR